MTPPPRTTYISDLTPTQRRALSILHEVATRTGGSRHLVWVNAREENLHTGALRALTKRGLVAMSPSVAATGPHVAARLERAGLDLAAQAHAYVTRDRP